MHDVIQLCYFYAVIDDVVGILCLTSIK